MVVGGGLIRTSEGKHISNFYSFYGLGTNNYVETKALLDRIVYLALNKFLSGSQ